MNNQEIFDRVAKHLLQQNCVAVTSFGCAYRGYKNTKCAIGALIPDDIYDPDMEGNDIISLLNKYPSIKNLFEGVDKTFLDKLQQCHDSIVRLNVDNIMDDTDHKKNKDFTSEISNNLRALAKLYKLEVNF